MIIQPVVELQDVAVHYNNVFAFEQQCFDISRCEGLIAAHFSGFVTAANREKMWIKGRSCRLVTAHSLASVGLATDVEDDGPSERMNRSTVSGSKVDERQEMQAINTAGETCDCGLWPFPTAAKRVHPLQNAICCYSAYKASTVTYDDRQ